MRTKTGTSLDLSRIGGYTAGIVALAFLVQGIAWSSTPLLFIPISGLTAILFLMLQEHRNRFLFFLIPLGPLINAVVLHRDPYLYNMEAILLTYFSIWFLLGHGQIFRISLTWTSSFYMLFILVVFTSTAVHLFSGDDPLSQIRLVRGFAIGFLLFLFLGCQRDRLNSLLPVFFKTTLLSFVVVAPLGIAEYAIGVSRGNWLIEPRSFFDGSESFAIYLVVMLPLALGAISPSNSRLFAFAWSSISAAGLFALIMTRSRAGLAAIFVYFMGYLLLGRTRKQRFAGLVFALVLASCIFWITLVKGGLLNAEIFPDLEHAAGKVFSSRIHPWSEGLFAIFTSPFWGHGSYENVYNVFLQIGAQFGAVAALVFIILLVKTWMRPSPRNRLRGLALPMGSSIFWSFTTLLVISLGESTLGNQLGYLGWFTIHLLGSRSIERSGNELNHLSS